MSLTAFRGYAYLATNAGLILAVAILFGYLLKPWKSKGKDKNKTRNIVMILMFSIELLMGAFLSLTLIWAFSGKSIPGSYSEMALNRLGGWASGILMPAGELLLIATIILSVLRYMGEEGKGTKVIADETSKSELPESINKAEERKGLVAERVGTVAVIAIFLIVSLYAAVCMLTPTSSWLQEVIGKN